jgi:putative transposase
MEQLAGVYRLIYNLALDYCQTQYKKTGKSPSWNQVSKELTAFKRTRPWMYDYDSQMEQQAIRDLRRAFENFFADCKKPKARRHFGFPKFKTKKNPKQSFRIPQRVVVKDGRIYIPSIGWVKIRQSQKIDLPTKSATFKRTAVGHWFVTLVAEFEMPAAKAPIREERAAGFDAVLQPPNYLVGSDGSEIPAPRYYRTMQKKLRRAARNFSKCKKHSRNSAKARIRLSKVHNRIANLRQNFLHQLSHTLVEKWDVLCFEDLNLNSLVKTKHAKSWLDAAFGELLRQCEYKMLWNSKHFVKVDRFFPSTKLCSKCGYKNNDLSLSDRQWICPECGTQHIRDFNAATNLKVEGLRILAVGCTESLNACGLPIRLAEASTAGGSRNGCKSESGREAARIPCL